METVTEILVDISGSMELKMAVTKHVLLNDILPELDESSRIGIKTFSTIPSTKQLSIVPVLPLMKTDKESIKLAIQKINFIKNGGTPIAASIRVSVKALSEYVANDKVIILITDGVETNGGNYVEEARKATLEGVNCKIHVIGIDLNEAGVKQANEIAQITSGTANFISIGKTNAYNQAVIRNNLSSFFHAVNPAHISSSVVAKPVNQPVQQIQKVSPPVNIQSVSIPIKEIPKVIEQSQLPANVTHNSTLDFIVEQIKEIRKEITELKNEKTETPEIIEDAELNEKIRKISEEYLYGILKKKYPDRVKWLNEKGESNADHDFEILDIDSSIEYYIECKGTAKNRPTFYLTKNEWRLFLNHTKNYQIYFVKNTFSNPSHIFIDNLLDWLLKMKIVPYLKEREVIKEERVFLTIHETAFDN